MKTSIIDQPRSGLEPDLFDIDGYQRALSKFIRNADTPITIALQGEWGSGKTSLMNSLQYNLSEMEKAPFIMYGSIHGNIP